MDLLLDKQLCDEDLAMLAADIGVIQRGDALPPSVRELMYFVIERCAAIAEDYRDDNGTAGDHIRAMFGPE